MLSGREGDSRPAEGPWEAFLTGHTALRAARLVGLPERTDHPSAADLLKKLNPSNLMSNIEKTSNFNFQPHDLTGEDL
jgi:hypothetical protein